MNEKIKIHGIEYSWDEFWAYAHALLNEGKVVPFSVGDKNCGSIRKRGKRFVVIYNGLVHPNGSVRAPKSELKRLMENYTQPKGDVFESLEKFLKN